MEIVSQAAGPFLMDVLGDVWCTRTLRSWKGPAGEFNERVKAGTSVLTDDADDTVDPLELPSHLE